MIKLIKITVVFCLAMFLFSCPSMAGEPSLSLKTFHVRFPTPTKQALNNGYIEKDRRKNISAFKITVYAGDGQGWRLYVRADNRMFSPGGYGKKCTDLKWKFDHENKNAYRRIKTSNQLVTSGSGKADITKQIDLKMVLDWSDPPADYKIGLTFSLKVD